MASTFSRGSLVALFGLNRCNGFEGCVCPTCVSTGRQAYFPFNAQHYAREDGVLHLLQNQLIELDFVEMQVASIWTVIAERPSFLSASVSVGVAISMHLHRCV
eukprot:3798426-Pleurochrysis_carterae.AAC.1